MVHNDLNSEVYEPFCTRVSQLLSDKKVKDTTRIAFFQFIDVVSQNNKDPFYFAKKVNELLSDIEQELKDLEPKIAEDKALTKTLLLEFNYSIGNIYRMLFAHMETFITAFYNMLNEAYNEREKRSLSALGKNVYDTDLPANWSSTKAIPPFTYFYKPDNESGGKKNTKKTLMWPDVSMAETKFVEKMIAASVAFGQEEQRVSKIIQELQQQSGTTSQTAYDRINYGDSVTSPSNYIAITPQDFVVNRESPYAYLKNENIQTSYFYQYALLTFGIRLAYFDMKTWHTVNNADRNTTKNYLPELFGRVEANNFKNEHPNKTKEIEEFLSKTKDDFIAIITGTKQDRLKITEPFTDPLLTKNGNDFDYTFYTGVGGLEMGLFPISMTDPTKIVQNLTSTKDYASVNGANITESDNYWVFVNPNDVLMPYIKTVNDTLEQNCRVAYRSLIGNPTKDIITGTKYYDHSTFNINIPSITLDTTTKETYLIYGQHFFYMQNNHQDANTRLFAKAYAFVMGINRHLAVTKVYGNVIPYITSLLRILTVGAAQYRSDYIDKNYADLIIFEEKDNFKYKCAEKDELYKTSALYFTLLPESSQSNYIKLTDFLNTSNIVGQDGKTYGNGNSKDYSLGSEFAKCAKNFFVN